MAVAKPRVQTPVRGAGEEPCRHRSLRASPAGEQALGRSSSRVTALPPCPQAPPHCQTLPKLLLCKGIPQEGLLSPGLPSCHGQGASLCLCHSPAAPSPQARGPGLIPQPHSSNPGRRNALLSPKDAIPCTKGKQQLMVCLLHNAGMGKTDPKLG